MGEAIQMACSEILGRRMLLATGREGIRNLTPTNRDQREEKIRTNKRTKGSKAQNPTTAGEVGAEAKDTNGGAANRIRPGRGNKDRGKDRRAEGTDKSARRSARELGIEWIGGLCPNGEPHYLIDSFRLDGGSIFRCKRCSKHTWLPAGTEDARKFSLLISKYGVRKGYCEMLDEHRPAKVMVAKLQELWKAKRYMVDKEQFLNLVLAVMSDKEYDKKEAS